MKKIRPFLFVCMFVLLSLSLTACAGRKQDRGGVQYGVFLFVLSGL